MGHKLLVIIAHYRNGFQGTKDSYDVPVLIFRRVQRTPQFSHIFVCLLFFFSASLNLTWYQSGRHKPLHRVESK